MLIFTGTRSAPAGTVTVTPASGMESEPPDVPIVPLTVMAEASFAFRCSGFTLVFGAGALERSATDDGASRSDRGLTVVESLTEHAANAAMLKVAKAIVRLRTVIVPPVRVWSWRSLRAL
jgi:hypothetical protein